MLWWVQFVPHLDLFIHFLLDTVWIHGVEWCLHHWWLLCSVQLPCSTESAAELFRQLMWDSFSSVFESKEKRTASFGLVFRRISSDWKSPEKGTLDYFLNHLPLKWLSSSYSGDLTICLWRWGTLAINTSAVYISVLEYSYFYYTSLCKLSLQNWILHSVLPCITWWLLVFEQQNTKYKWQCFVVWCKLQKLACTWPSSEGCVRPLLHWLLMAPIPNVSISGI